MQLFRGCSEKKQTFKYHLCDICPSSAKTKTATFSFVLRQITLGKRRNETASHVQMVYLDKCQAYAIPLQTFRVISDSSAPPLTSLYLSLHPGTIGSKLSSPTYKKWLNKNKMKKEAQTFFKIKSGKQK
ncbi:hypothetical protein CEXT_598801 [Caerostris extrusa]|uniref:Uncharacterized protein n=1 Tax=Caerostris extrusa TaxID=172846 RepID=A0AAV4XN26_CAEEX|nr:hypothetical protein CEXT_598801 [Caerostris extrusa]